MQRYNVKFFGKQYTTNTTGLVLHFFFTIFIFITGLMGVFKFGGWLAILALFALTSSVTFSGKTYSLVPFEKVRSVISPVAIYGGVLFYFFG